MAELTPERLAERGTGVSNASQDDDDLRVAVEQLREAADEDELAYVSGHCARALLAEVERLQAEVATARQDAADLREAFAWVLDETSWREWLYWPAVPEAVKRLTNIDELVAGDTLELRLVPGRVVSGE